MTGDKEPVSHLIQLTRIRPPRLPSVGWTWIPDCQLWLPTLCDAHRPVSLKPGRNRNGPSRALRIEHGSFTMSKRTVLPVAVMLIAIAAALSATVASNAAENSGPTSQTSTPSSAESSSGERWFIKYDGIEGESTDDNHDKWIDVLNIDWGIHQPGGGQTGATRRRGSVVVEDITLTMEYEKSSPKLQEKMLMGEVIPKLEIELTATYGGARATYLKYELKNVMVTSFQTGGSADDGPPTVVVGNNFEEMKVTYTEYDDTGASKGNVETEFKVEKGG